MRIRRTDTGQVSVTDESHGLGRHVRHVHLRRPRRHGHWSDASLRGPCRHRSVWRPRRRPERLGRPVLARRGDRVMRLTARGRGVLLGLILTIGLLIGWFAEDLSLIGWWR